MSRNWLQSLQQAQQALAKTTAPAWLAQALARAQAQAAALAPPPAREDAAPEFFYPH